MPASTGSVTGEPAWEIATLFPNQGCWSEEEYLDLNTNHLVEFTCGNIEVLPMPTEAHQAIVEFLHAVLKAFAAGLGTARFSPLRVKSSKRKFREPDVVFMLKGNDHRRGNEFWKGADLVMEVVSDDDAQRDTVKKRQDYAKAGIPEYWIVDPRDRTITVLTLPAGKKSYKEAGVYSAGDQAASVLLDGFQVDVKEAFSQP